MVIEEIIVSATNAFTACVYTVRAPVPSVKYAVRKSLSCVIVHELVALEAYGVDVAER